MPDLSRPPICCASWAIPAWPDDTRRLLELVRDAAADPLIEQDGARLGEVVKARARGETWADAVADSMERHYSQGRTWEATLRGLLGLLRLRPPRGEITLAAARLARALEAEGRHLESHAIQALAVESAEAAAELLHKKLHGEWGFPELPDATMMDMFQAHHRGKRYSFGYPACPELAMQSTLFSLLRPEEIGVTLTEEHTMEPEASVSAVVFHHPEAKYFSVGKEHR